VTGGERRRIVAARAVTKSYGAFRALDRVSFDILEGEKVVIIGPSGSGKSTLLNIIGLLERPTAGTLSIRGRDTAALGESELTALRGRTLGFVFQFHHLIPAFDALENTLMPMLIDRGRITPEMRERAAWLLEQVGLGDALGKKPAELSGGMQQRVAIARALAMSPPMVLADEPTGNLDTHTADEIFDLMRRFNAEHDTAFLVVTHDPRLAARCSRRIELVDGRVVAS